MKLFDFNCMIYGDFQNPHLCNYLQFDKFNNLSNTNLMQYANGIDIATKRSTNAIYNM